MAIKPIMKYYRRIYNYSFGVECDNFNAPSKPDHSGIPMKPKMSHPEQEFPHEQLECSRIKTNHCEAWSQRCQMMTAAHPGMWKGTELCQWWFPRTGVQVALGGGKWRRTRAGSSEEGDPEQCQAAAARWISGNEDEQRQRKAPKEM